MEAGDHEWSRTIGHRQIWRGAAVEQRLHTLGMSILARDVESGRAWHADAPCGIFPSRLVRRRMPLKEGIDAQCMPLLRRNVQWREVVFA